MKQRILIFIMVIVLAACKKTAGEGGKASISGKVWVEDWNAAFTIKNGEYAGYDQDVYILYGDAVSYSEKTKANYNGEFEFKYLRKGNYTIYVYSKDKTLTSKSGDTVVVQTVEITENKQNLSLAQFTIFD